MAQRKRDDSSRAFYATLSMWTVGLIADIVLRVNGITAPEVDGTLAALTGLMVGNLTSKTSNRKDDDDE